MARLQYLQIELCGVCNARCSYCTWQERKTGKQMMNAGLAFDLVDQAAQMTVDLVTFHGIGEATLHPDCADIIADADERHIRTRLSTNCSKLDGELAYDLSKIEGLQLILAMHFTLAENDPDFLKRCLANAREYLHVGFHNRSVECLLVVDEASRAYVDGFVETFAPYARNDKRVYIHLKQPQTWPNSAPVKGWVPKHLIGRRGLVVEAQETPRSLGNGCNMPENLLMVLADGTVVPCCVGTEDFGLGRIGDRTLKQIWESAEMEALRDKWRASDMSIPCGHCKTRTDCV